MSTQWLFVTFILFITVECGYIQEKYSKICRLCTCTDHIDCRVRIPPLYLFIGKPGLKRLAIDVSKITVTAEEVAFLESTFKSVYIGGQATTAVTAEKTTLWERWATTVVIPEISVTTTDKGVRRKTTTKIDYTTVADLKTSVADRAVTRRTDTKILSSTVTSVDNISVTPTSINVSVTVTSSERMVPTLDEDGKVLEDCKMENVEEVSDGDRGYSVLEIALIVLTCIMAFIYIVLIVKKIVKYFGMRRRGHQIVRFGRRGDIYGDIALEEF